MWIFHFKLAISFLKSLQCLKFWTITFFPVTSFQISHKATWQTTKMFSKHLAVDSSFTTWKMQETDSLQFCWVHILTIERSTCATVLWPNMEQLHIEGEKERKNPIYSVNRPPLDPVRAATCASRSLFSCVHPLRQGWQIRDSTFKGPPWPSQQKMLKTYFNSHVNNDIRCTDPSTLD